MKHPWKRVQHAKPFQRRAKRRPVERLKAEFKYRHVNAVELLANEKGAMR